METDHTRRLVKLISLVAYTEGKTFGLRQPYGLSRPDLAAALPEDQTELAREMCRYYAGAVRHVLSGGREYLRDYEELADYTLPFVTNAGPDVEELLGDILVSSLSLLEATELRVVGRKWLDDVIDTCWAAKVAAAPESYGNE